jgi:formylglycine-generating enzyme required for sulfatase activity
MLQARDCVCIVFLALTSMQALDSRAQDDPQQAGSSKIQRLGDSGVEKEYQLDFNVPGQATPEASPPPTAQSQAAESFEREMAVEQHLAAASRAEREGRIDQPPADCAWLHYRSALDLDPGNAAAQLGLLRVQDALIARAEDFAHDMDFESAERTLEDALLVRGDHARIDEARQTIRGIRRDYAAELESAAVQAMDAGDFERSERMLIELIALGNMDATVNQLRRRLEEARVYGGFKPGQIIRDHFMNQGTWSPELVILTAGSFVMGSSAFEEGRMEHEGPEHRVTFRRGFAIGRTEISVAEFRTFVDRTRYRTDAERFGYSMIYDHFSGRLARREGVNWEMDYEGRKANEDEPVIHVSWNDAQAYARWLAQGTGKAYRLPTEAELEYAQRAGKTTRYWWGDDAPTRLVENLTGEKDVSRNKRQWATAFEDYGDRYWGPAPVGSFEPNPFGLHDMGGNVSEWTTDCWHDTYLRAPTDGSAWVNPGCKLRVIRGGYWASSPDQSRAAYRVSAQPEHRDARVGFRIARDL